MKRVICIGILTAAAIAGSVYWHDNRSVYSLQIYAGGVAYGPQWHTGAPPNWIGFTQYTEVGFPNEWGKRRDTPTFTEIDLSSYRFRIKAQAWQVGLIAVSILGFLSWLASGALDDLRNFAPPSTRRTFGHQALNLEELYFKKK